MRTRYLETMKVVCAPDSFKESMTALQAARAMAEGLREIHGDAELLLKPVADGGEGTTEAMVVATGGTIHRASVTGALGDPIDGFFGVLGSPSGVSAGATAVVETAAAAGLASVPHEKRDPTRTTTFGTGELIRLALQAPELPVRRLILALGGSATNDGGCGAAQALGVRFEDQAGHAITDPITGGSLRDIARVIPVDWRGEFGVELVVACDVDNPLAGKRGASSIYGPQKGATPAQVQQLDDGLKHLADLVADATGQDLRDMPGAGAAGGFGFGAVALLGGRLEAGFPLVSQAIGLAEALQGADLCLTGEGRLDEQTLSGKAVMGVTRLAVEAGLVPSKVWALVGSVGKGGAEAAGSLGIGHVVLSTELSQAESMARGPELMRAAAARVAQNASAGPV